MEIRGKRVGATGWLAASLGLLLTNVPVLQVLAADTPDEETVFKAEAKPTQPFNKMIQSLVVTARKTEERPQQVPVSLTTITTEEIKATNVRRLQDIQNSVPNLLIDQGQGQANSARVSLRGLAQVQDLSTNDPVVGVYVDGVFRPRLQGELLTLYDVDRVEVLRGPQGTLFGKNTIGGAINITTKAPEFELGGNAELRYGNFDMLETRFSLNVPLVPEKAAARISLSTATRDGYIKNVLNDDDYQDNKMLGGRLQFTILPREDVEVNLSVEATKEDRKGFGSKCKVTGKGFDFGQLLTTGQLADGSLLNFRKQCAEDDARSDFKIANDLSFTGDGLSTQAYAGRVTWDITPDLTFTSITSFRNQDIDTFFDADATPTNLIQFQNDGGGDTQRAFTQEFQITGLTGGGRLRYVGGLFFLTERNTEREFFGLGFEPALDENFQFQFVTDDRDPTHPVDRLLIQPASTVNVNVLKDGTKSFAAYGQATYSITDQLDLTVGARLTKDQKRVRNIQLVTACTKGAAGQPCRDSGAVGFGPMGPGSFSGFERTGRFDDLSPSVSLAYAFSPKILVYASYNQGFQSGGFNGSPTSDADTDELENQELIAYEVGLKSTWLEDRLVFNTSLFYNILDEGTRVPVFTVNSAGQLVENSVLDVGAEVKGAEIELGLLPVTGLQLRANIGLQRGELDSFAKGEALGLSKGRLPAVPNVTMNFSADYEKQLGNLGTLGLRTSWSVRGANNPVIQRTETLDVARYGLLDGRVSYELPDGRTQIAAFGSNLLDRRYFIGGFAAEDFGFVNRFFGPPRFYGVEISRKF